MDLNHVALTGTLDRDPTPLGVESTSAGSQATMVPVIDATAEARAAPPLSTSAGLVAPCPVCRVRTVVARRRSGEGTVTLDLRPGLRCFQLVIHDGDATAAESIAYPEHGPLCPGAAPALVAPEVSP